MEHKIQTIAELVKLVNSENIENLLIDLEGFLRQIVLFKTTAKSNDFELKAMIWIDDNEHNIEANIIARKIDSNGNCS